MCDKQHHPLQCQLCGGILNLFYKNNNIITPKLNFLFQDSVFWQCESCNNITISKYCKDITQYFIRNLVGNGHIGNVLVNFRENFIEFKQKKGLFISTDNNKQVKFNYDPIDYYFIEGLYRRHEIGFLTPVFFNKNVLVKFIDNPDYTIEYGSNSSIGTIWGEDWNITFGINSNNNVITWLGDLYYLPEKEQLYFKSENIPSDHNIASEFYNSHILVEWPKLSSEQKILSSIIELNNINTIPKISILEKDFKKEYTQIHLPEYNTQQKLNNVTNMLNKLLIEKINAKFLKQYIRQHFRELSKKEQSYGSIKTLELFLNLYAQNNSININIQTLLCPLYVLYDLRILGSHTSTNSFEEKYLSCLTRLNINIEHKDDCILLYKTLLEKLASMFYELVTLLKK